MHSSNSQNWIETMKDEMKSMNDNEFWNLIELPEGVKPIGCKWIFKIKKDSKGNIERYKARLVAKGFTQKEGIDYKETFSPVSSNDSFRTIMALVARFDLELHQMDVKIVFLNGDIEETIYMVQPKNYQVTQSLWSQKGFTSTILQVPLCHYRLMQINLKQIKKILIQTLYDNEKKILSKTKQDIRSKNKFKPFVR